MKTKIILLLAVLALSTTGMTAQNRAETLRQHLMDRDTSYVMVVAHRGDWRYQPENSIAAIEHAISIGADIVEVDLQMTKDSVLILMHDISVFPKTARVSPTSRK